MEVSIKCILIFYEQWYFHKQLEIRCNQIVLLLKDKPTSDYKGAIDPATMLAVIRIVLRFLFNKTRNITRIWPIEHSIAENNVVGYYFELHIWDLKIKISYFSIFDIYWVIREGDSIYQKMFSPCNSLGS